MPDFELDAKEIENRAYGLTQSMDRMRSAQADRDDVVVEMKQATRTRLELLARELQPLFSEVPNEIELFDFGLSTGEPPRLWIDVTSHVRMARDRRVYEFVKDTRLGRTILAQSEHKERIAEVVTDYVAERLLERQRTIEGEWLSMKNYKFDQAPDGNNAAFVPGKSKKKGIRSFLWFIGGIFFAAVAMFTWAWFGEFPTR